MLPLLFAAFPTNNLWYFVPLLIVISLVYGATRHEYMAPILQHAVRAGIWILTFMGSIFAILLIIAWML